MAVTLDVKVKFLSYKQNSKMNFAIKLPFFDILSHMVRLITYVYNIHNAFAWLATKVAPCLLAFENCSAMYSATEVLSACKLPTVVNTNGCKCILL